MPELFPFPGLRYEVAVLDAGLGAVTAPPYDVIDEESRARLEASHPLNAVRLILPRDAEPGDRYERARATFEQWRADGILSADAPHLYLYRTAFTEIFRQARLYSEGFAQLQRKYEPPRTGPPALIRWPFESWKPILRELPRARDRAARGRLAWALGWQAGRFSGSVKHRVLAA